MNDLVLTRRLYAGALMALGVCLMGLAIAAGGSGLWLAPLVALFLYLTYRTHTAGTTRARDDQQRFQQMSQLHLATIEALARAINATDRMSPQHLTRMQAYAIGLARAVGMSEHDIQGLRIAALLHDIGKVAVPAQILSKPGSLTAEEFLKVHGHPQVGAEIIGQVPFPYPVATLIRSHHERWDGMGYPDGLSGEKIPTGARIIGLVDYFEALTTDRPYHRAMSPEAAVGLLRQEAGKGLDSTLVDKFIDMLPSLKASAEGTHVGPAGSAAAPAATPRSSDASDANIVYDDIARAHQEIYDLYDLALAMGTSLGVSDTTSLICSKLGNVIPLSCCAVFLHDEEGDTLRCRFAAGTDAELIQKVALRSGDGLTGWVARNRRPLLNARPSADLDAAGLSEHSTRLQSSLVYPLVMHERLIGTLAVYHVEPAFYRDDHVRLLSRVAEQAAAVLSNSLLFEQAFEDSLRDPLTNLPNTRFLFMHLTRELARAQRLRSPLSLLVLDLDDFKEINDHHGHHVGDRTLCEVTRVLQAVTRPYDICVRYAGDEFILVLSGCGADEAERKRVELQKAIDELHVEVQPGKHISLSMSAGAAMFPEDGESYELLLSAADRRMYQDKSRRKRQAAAQGKVAPVDPDYSDAELQRAASGIL